MALFERWDADVLSGPTPAERYLSPSASSRHSHSYLHNQQSDEIFSIEKLQLEANLDYGAVVDLEAGSNCLSLLTANKQIVQWDLVNDVQQALAVTLDSGEVASLFVDSTATHLLVSFQSGSAFYLHETLKKPQLLSRAVHSSSRFKLLNDNDQFSLQGLVIECVCWIPSSNDATPSLLVGSRTGTIFLLNLASRDKPLQKLFSVPDGVPLYGLQCELFPQQQKWLVMAATSARLFQFVGGPDIQSLFKAYAHDQAPFIEIPGTLARSELHFYREERAKSVSWLTSAGLYHGKLSFERDMTYNTLVEDYRLISFPLSDQVPVSVCVTKFHFLFLYEHRLVAVNQLNSEIVFDSHLPLSLGEMAKIVQDTVMKSIFIYSSSAVCEVIVENEQRDMWKLYMDENKFADALETCPDSMRKSVYKAQGDYLFSKGEYVPAAAVYSYSDYSFEEIALKFVSCNATDALTSFLRKKLVLTSPKDLTQRTMICTWLTELYLDKLSTHRDDIDTSVYEDVVSEFNGFLSDFRSNLDRDTTFELISSHGRVSELLQYAKLIGEVEWVINYHVQQAQYREALDALVVTFADATNSAAAELVYKFAPVLLDHLPQETATMLMQNMWLDPSRLLPALMRYESNQENSLSISISYLEGAIDRGCSDSSIHNYLVSLYAKLGDNGKRLLSFLESQDVPQFDLKFCLRLCHQEKLNECCVRLYEKMSLFQEAVNMALLISLDLAKEIAGRLPDDNSDKKGLWLQIARHVIKEKNDIRSAIGVLRQCSYLRLDDILPCFPDDVRISDFKGEIIDTLEAYNSRIEELKNEMDNYTNSATLIRSDIAALRSRSAYVAPRRSCDLCNRSLLSDTFYLFPCGHAFHTKCSARHQQQLREDTQRLPRIAKTSFFDSDIESESSVGVETSPVPTEGSQCVFCGDSIIDSVDLPFVDPNAADPWAL